MVITNMMCLNGADALLIVTEWSAFRTPDFDQLESLLKNKVIFDGRNLYDLQKIVSRLWIFIITVSAER